MRLAALFPLILALSGCVVGPNYHRPRVQTPAQFRGADTMAQQADSLADLPWWGVYADPVLQDLVRTALANNYDLLTAARRVEQARAMAAEARAAFYPAAGYESALSTGRNEFAGNSTVNGGVVRGAFAAVGRVSWEADMWGRIRRSNEAALAAYLQTEEARRGVRLLVASETAQAYFELLGFDLQLQIARRTTESFDATVSLFQRRLEAGAASRLDTSRAEAARAAAASTIPELERQILLKENQISVLLGRNPGPIERNGSLLERQTPPAIPAGLPSDLLERRPDVRSAEQLVRQRNAQVGVAQAAYFPRIGLTALVGALSTPLSDIVDGRTPAFSFASNLAGPVYQGGALKARKSEAVAAWQQAVLGYQQTALNAFRDVADALASREKFEQIRTQQLATVAAYRESVEVVLKRYASGRSSYFEVLEAQQQLFPAENAEALTEINRRVVIVQLYKALGGGWKLSDEEWVSVRASSGR